jgi:hypothetical protein
MWVEFDCNRIAQIVTIRDLFVGPNRKEVSITMSTLSAANGLGAELRKSKLLPEDKLRGFLAAHKESPLDDQVWAKWLVAEQDTKRATTGPISIAWG